MQRIAIHALIIVLGNVVIARCETYAFGSGIDVFEMEFVTVADPGNPHDSRTTPPMGAVDYTYEIGKFEVSCGFLTSANEAGAFTTDFAPRNERCGGGDSDDVPQEQPWLTAVEFVNWLNIDAGHPPAYRVLDGNTPDIGRWQPWEPEDPGYSEANPFRNSRAKFVLPSLHEWHKAAYYDPSEGVYRLYATGDTPPVSVPPGGGTEPNTALISGSPVNIMMAGGLSAYGTMAQTGNAPEWEERFVRDDGLFSAAFVRWGANAGSVDLQTAITARAFSLSAFNGFRVAAVTPVPEPSSLTLLAFALCSLGAFRRRR